MESSLASPLVLGAGGRLGRAVEDFLSPLAPATIGATRAEIDITDYFRLCEELERLRPTLVVNCASLADVDRCEREPEVAMRVNADGAGFVARASRSVGARLIHVSTDCVFDGRGSMPHSEDDPPAPLSRYGLSKWEGEKLVLAEDPEALVVRTNWLFGPAGGDFVERTLELARRERWVGGVVDQVGSPTYTPDLAQALAELAASPSSGVVHFTNSGACTRHEFALRIVEMAGIARGLEQRPQRWTDLGRPARRPANSLLSTARYTRITSRVPRPWSEALAEHLACLGAPRR
jgi:dTDP-4-dehydrorhamnose reductase